MIHIARNAQSETRKGYFKIFQFSNFDFEKNVCFEIVICFK